MSSFFPSSFNETAITWEKRGKKKKKKTELLAFALQPEQSFTKPPRSGQILYYKYVQIVLILLKLKTKNIVVK